MTVTDDDEPQWVLTALPATIAENAGTAEVQVASGGVTFLAPQEIGLTFAGSAAKGTDYTVAAETLTLAVGATAVATTITATDDSVADAAETIEITASLDGARIGTTATVTITDDERPSTKVTLSVTPATVGEGAGATELTVTGMLDGAAVSAATEVALAVSDGTAEAADYGATTATLTIAGAQTSGMATLTLTPVDDHVDEPNETVSVGGTVTGSLTVTPTTVTITDDDEPQWALTALPATIAENGGTTEVQVASGGVTFLAAREIGLSFAGSAARDADYTVAAETLTLAVGASAAATTITANNDIVVDAAETIEITASLDGARIGTTATVTITDDEIPSTMVTLSVTPDTVAEDAGATELTVTGTLDRDAPSVATEVALAVSDGTAVAADYGATTATLTIAAAQTSGMATLTLTPVDDRVDEPNETVSVGGTVTGGGLTVTAAQVTVADNDTAGVTVAPQTASVTEGGTADDYTVVLDSQPAGTVVVSVSGADAGVDVSVSPSPLTFSSTTWNSARTVTVQAVDDHLVEGEEQVTLSHSVTGYGSVVSAGNVIVTVTDDDRRPSAPRGLEAVARNTQVMLSWRAPFDSGSRPITRYEVRWKETDGGTFNAWTDVGTATGYVVQSLVNDTGYTFEVQAVNESELAGPAVSVDATPTERPPVVELSPGAELEEGDAVTLTITPPDSPYESDTTLTVALVSVAENQGVAPGPVAGTDYTVAVGDTELAPRYHRFDAAGDLASGPQPYYALTLTAGELSTAVTLTAIDDQEPEGQEYASIHVLEDGAELNGSGDGFWIAASDLRPEPASATAAGNTVTLTFSRGLRLIEDPGQSDGHPDDTWIPLAPEMYFTRFTGDEPPVFDEHNLAAPAPGQPEGQIASGFSLRGDTLTLTFPDPVSASENVWIAYHLYSAYAPLGDGSEDPDGRPVRKFLVKVQGGADVLGAAALQVADAEAAEADLSADFAVTLDGAADGPVTVDYATADGTAQAGADYTATLGTLTFTPGRTALTVAVPVHDDGINEGAESFTLTLSNAAGAVLADAEATGTIVNDDPLPRAWLARFGRTAAGHVLDAVAARLQGDHAAESQATIAGHALSAPAGEEADAAAREAWERAWDGRVQEEPQTMPFQQLLAGSSFHLALPAPGSAGDATGAAGAEESGGWTVWGRTAWTQFTGADAGAGLDLDGEVLTATAGADYAWDRLLAGLAVAYSTGAGTYRHAPSEDSGELRIALLGVHPYLRLTLHERLAVWGVFGYAVLGDLSVQAASADVDTGAGMLMGAGGVRATLLDAADTGFLELTATADGLLLRVRSDPAPGLLASTADVQRLRLLLRASHHGVPVLGGLLTPAVEIGGRYDGGDAETGAGLVVGGSLSYSLPAWGLTLTAAGQGLLVHEHAGFREWGVAGTVLFDPGAPGRGIALRVVPSWGTAAAGGGERLWSLADASALAATDRFHPAARLDAELSYGLDAPGGNGTLIPYAAVALAAAGERTWRLGSRLSIDAGFSLSLEGTRTEPAGAADPDDSVTFKVTLRS